MKYLTKKSRKKIICAVLLFLAIIGLFSAVRFYRSPRMTVTRAWYRSFGQNHTGTLLQSEILSGTLSLTLNRLEPSGELVKELSFDPVDLEGFGLETELVLDTKRNTFFSNSEVSYLMKPYGHLDFYTDTNLLALHSPELSDFWFTVNPASLGKDFNASPLPQFLEMTVPEDFSCALFLDKTPVRDTFLRQLNFLFPDRELLRQAEITLLSSEHTKDDNYTYQITVPSGQSFFLTLTPQGDIEGLYYEQNIVIHEKSYPFTLLIQPVTEPMTEQLSGQLTGQLVLYAPSEKTPDSVPLFTMDYAVLLSESDNGALCINLKELICKNTYGSFHLYGSLFLEASASAPATEFPFSAENSRNPFLLTEEALEQLGNEMLDRMEQSELLVLKGYLPWEM
ncbi:MAG: hypothetical protein GX234_08800 [Clostridiales bacterium]|nr:hypothetical protein [Clostridiales bacterium]